MDPLKRATGNHAATAKKSTPTFGSGQMRGAFGPASETLGSMGERMGAFTRDRWRQCRPDIRSRQREWWARQDSNLQPDGYEPPALTS